MMSLVLPSGRATKLATSSRTSFRRSKSSRQAEIYGAVKPVNSDHMSVNKGGLYRQVVTQYRAKVMLKAPVGAERAFGITFDLYKATAYKIMFFYGRSKQVSLYFHLLYAG